MHGPVVLRVHKISRKYISCRLRKLMYGRSARVWLPAATLLVARERWRNAMRKTSSNAGAKGTAARAKGAGESKGPTETKAAGGVGQAQAVKCMLTKIEEKMTGNQMKATLGDYIRLVQLHKELDDESPKEIRVTWVEPSEKGSANEE